MVFTFEKCLMLAGVVQAEVGLNSWQPCIVPTIIDGVQYDLASITATPWVQSPSWTSATLDVQWGNANIGVGPWNAFSPAAQVTTSVRAFPEIEIVGQFLALVCTAAESGVYLNLYLHLRKTF